LIAILYATKNHLRADWGAKIIPGTSISPNTGTSTLIPEYAELLPKSLKRLDDGGVGLPLQLTFLVEQYIKRCFVKGVFHGPQTIQMQVQLNTLTDAYGRMETIRLTGIPVAHLYVALLPNPAVSRLRLY
jgi:putative membrane protein